MDNVTRIAVGPSPVEFIGQLPGGPNGFQKWNGDEETLQDAPYCEASDPNRMGLAPGVNVAFGSIIMEVEGFTDDPDGRYGLNHSGIDPVVVSLGGHGCMAAESNLLICNPIILKPLVMWRFNNSFTAPCQIGSPLPAPDAGQWLYIIRDANYEIIYVGISYDATNRWTQHQKDKPWFDHAVSFERIWYPTRESVAAAEERMISQIRPRYNTQHNPDRRPV